MRADSVLGPYRVVRLLERGGMGAVYEAGHVQLYSAAQVEDPEPFVDERGRAVRTGHWENRDAYHDPVMATCLCALQLMVYYRYLPTTSLHAAEPEKDVAVLAKDVRDELGVSVDL